LNLAIQIARRYLFAKKTTNAINVITGISVFGITLGTAALVLVLSVFNGFHDLLSGLFNTFNPDIKVTPALGKTFESDTFYLETLRAVEGVAFLSETIEEVAFFQYKKSEDFGTLKGVDQYFDNVTGIDSMVQEGLYSLKEGKKHYAVLGSGMRNKLTVNVDDYLSEISVYMPKRKNVGPFEKAFTTRYMYPSGTFYIQQEFDNQYILTDLDFVRSLLKAKENEVSSYELKVKDGADVRTVAEAVRGVMGEDFLVRDRFQQDAAFLKLMNIEKWISFAIVSLTLLLVAFNIIGSLWMIVLEKKNDIGILKSMGATELTIRNIFLYEGLLLCGIGMVIGFVISLLLYFIHTNVGGGLIPISQGFLVDAYPIRLMLTDFIAVFLIVMVIGFLASIVPANKAKKMGSLVRE